MRLVFLCLLLMQGVGFTFGWRSRNFKAGRSDPRKLQRGIGNDRQRDDSQ
jgi:hypothetical protein